MLVHDPHHWVQHAICSQSVLIYWQFVTHFWLIVNHLQPGSSRVAWGAAGHSQWLGLCAGEIWKQLLRHVSCCLPPSWSQRAANHSWRTVALESFPAQASLNHAIPQCHTHSNEPSASRVIHICFCLPLLFHIVPSEATAAPADVMLGAILFQRTQRIFSNIPCDSWSKMIGQSMASIDKLRAHVLYQVFVFLKDLLKDDSLRCFFKWQMLMIVQCANYHCLMYAKFKLSYKVCCLEVWKIQELELQITRLCLYFLLMKTFTQVILWVGDKEYHSACIYIYYTFLHDYTCRSGTILTWFLLS